MELDQPSAGPRVADHPVRIARLRAQLSTKELADRAYVTRSAVTQIEDGRTIAPKDETIWALAKVLGMRAEDLQAQIRDWRHQYDRSAARLGPRARAALALSPDAIRKMPSFRVWREHVAPTPTAFASLLGLHRSVVAQYEKGIRARGMSDELAGAMLRRLQLTPAQLAALQGLEPDHE